MVTVTGCGGTTAPLSGDEDVVEVKRISPKQAVKVKIEINREIIL